MSTYKELVVFDLDGVLANFVLHFSEWIVASKLTDVFVPDITQHSLGYSLREFAQLHDDFAREGKFLTMPVYDDTLNVIKKLVKRDCKIGYFTARQSFTGDGILNRLIQKQTRKWLRSVKAPHTENLHFCGKGLKRNTFIDLGGTAMVEDHLETAVDIGNLKPPHGRTIKSFLIDRPWNRHQEYPRLNHISELLSHFP